MLRLEAGKGGIFHLQPVEDGFQHQSNRALRHQSVQPPAHVAQGIVGADGKAGQAGKQRNQLRLQPLQLLRVGRCRSRRQHPLGFIDFHRIDQQRHQHGSCPLPGIRVMIDKTVSSRNQPTQIEVFAKEISLRLPQCLQLCECLLHLEFAAQQHDQPGMMPEQFRLARKFAAQVFQMQIKRFFRAARLLRSVTLDDLMFERLIIQIPLSMARGTPAFAMLIKGKEPLKPVFFARPGFLAEHALSCHEGLSSLMRGSHTKRNKAHHSPCS
ncbi:hypothetical protein Avi_3131 [Allorhizobium ampelinum S4]|uniref:Uncharacterized protein n=1 Tax=Allorhizobium ampelinum (strain ATCC BAA-846 / DSM 112012 / S4) TaxID=311402 RepID=B9JZ00_ALLAM|nr:hypothetical protein Avi_3131 [Allorhizobium ampelinum S4]